MLACSRALGMVAQPRVPWGAQRPEKKLAAKKFWGEVRSRADTSPMDRARLEWKIRTDKEKEARKQLKLHKARLAAQEEDLGPIPDMVEELLKAKLGGAGSSASRKSLLRQAKEDFDETVARAKLQLEPPVGEPLKDVKPDFFLAGFAKVPFDILNPLPEASSRKGIALPPGHLSGLESFLKDKFQLETKRKALYVRAFTHQSYVQDPADAQDVLASLGEVLMPAFVHSWLVQVYPDRPAAEYVQLRELLLQKNFLRQLAVEWRLHNHLLTSQGVADKYRFLFLSTPRELGINEEALALHGLRLWKATRATLLALVGAVYLDLGSAAAGQLVGRHVIGWLVKTVPLDTATVQLLLADEQRRQRLEELLPKVLAGIHKKHKTKEWVRKKQTKPKFRGPRAKEGTWGDS